MSIETTVNLLVDGQVVRTATGPNSETLDWAGWDVRDLAGETARIQIVDNNISGWGHILADQFTFADAAALSATQRAHWLDYGRDFYAGVTFNNVPAEQADHDRLDEQLAIRQLHPHRPLAKRHESAP